MIYNSSKIKTPNFVIKKLQLILAELSSLMPNSLSSLAASLKHLVLSNNRLQDVPTKALRQLRGLDHINLGQNNISVIKDGAFRIRRSPFRVRRSKVTRLSLYDNKIHKIHSDAFDGLAK